MSIGHSFSVGVMHVDLHLPGCRSLKQKRGRLAKVMNHIRKKHQIAVAEVGDHNVWGRAGLAVVALSRQRDLVNQMLEAVAQTLMREQEAELVYYEIEFR